MSATKPIDRKKAARYLHRTKAPVQRIGGAFSAVPMASVLEQAWIPKKEEIAHAVRTTMEWTR